MGRARQKIPLKLTRARKTFCCQTWNFAKNTIILVELVTYQSSAEGQNVNTQKRKEVKSNTHGRCPLIAEIVKHISQQVKLSTVAK